MSDRAQYTILCEDKQSQVLIRRALLAKGAERRRIRLIALPGSAGGAGDAFVREKYAAQVKAFRREAAGSATGLIVHMDADVGSVAARKLELDQLLKREGLDCRGSEEAIAVLVPKRNIETWIYSLDKNLRNTLKHGLDETQALPKLGGQESDCHEAAKAFAEHAKKGTEPETVAQVPSLRDGLAEWRRLP